MRELFDSNSPDFGVDKPSVFSPLAESIGETPDAVDILKEKQ